MGPVMRLQVTDLFFRPLYAFFLVELKSRKVIQVKVTRAPTDPWVAHHLREATPDGQAPKYLIRETDRQFGQHVARVAFTSGIKGLRTPDRTRPRECRLRTLSLKRETRRSGSFPDIAGEATPPPPEAHLL
jgi:hypothetical protein